MKKMITVFVLLTVFLLSACSSGSTSSNASNMNSSQKTNEHIEDRNKYDEYVKNVNRLPDNFVSWDDVSLIGDVWLFTVSCELFYGEGEITQYTYAINDGNTDDLNLKINHDPETTSLFSSFSELFDKSKRETITKAANMESMKKISAEQNENGYVYVINRNGLEYIYNKFGEIVMICWSIDGIHFQLDGRLLRYPENPKPSFVTKLLSADDEEANQAFAEFKAALTK